jgi:hypothetical protein
MGLMLMIGAKNVPLFGPEEQGVPKPDLKRSRSSLNLSKMLERERERDLY